MQSLREIFYAHDGNLIHKWDHYFEIYETYFEKYRGAEVNLLEIGVAQGGSIEMWHKYFGENIKIYSVDINPECLKFKGLTEELYIGSQEDPDFLQKLKNELPQMDIIIDDGGHTMKQQILTFEYLFLKLKENGIFLVEDTHTSYWSVYGGGLRKKNSFIEYSKRLIDSLYIGHLNKVKNILNNEITENIRSICFYDSIVVFTKGKRQHPFHLKRGKETISYYPMKFKFFQKLKIKMFGMKDVTIGRNWKK
jgi:23S rRNA U2552 (ribose-2'-O)-methylase RlmE/FtsJ